MHNDVETYILERIDKLNDEISDIKQRIIRIENNWKWVRRIGYLILAFIASQLGIDISGIQL